MKLSADSPELTAYALGELNPAERAQVEAALHESPELRAEVMALQHTVGRLADEFAAEPSVALSVEQRAAIVGQAASLPAADPVGAEVTRLTSPAEDRDSSCRLLPTEGGPTLWQRLLAWRQQLIWAAVGACAVALSFSFWPRQRDALTEFNQLRYQTLPAVSDPPPPERVGPGAPAGPSNRDSKRAEELEAVVVSKPLPDPARPLKAPSPAASPVVIQPAPVSPTSAARKTVAAPAGGAAEPKLAQRYGLAPRGAQGLDTAIAESKAAPMTEAPQPQMPMDPILGRRYGLAPRRESSATPAPADLGRSKVGAAAPRADALGRERARSLVKSAPASAVPNFAGGTVISDELMPEAMESRYLRYRPIAPIYPQPGGEGYEAFADNDFKSVASVPLSTFSLDVDTASYANTRRFLREGSLPPRAAVRLEELINYFHYDYPQPRGEHPFLASIELAESPWKEGHKLVRLGLQAKAVDRRERPAANLVFLVDVSGSMEPENKLPLVKRSLRLLLDKLTERDRVGIVTYAGESRVAAEPTGVSAAGKAKLLSVIEGLRAGSGTHGSAGIQMAYAMATNQFNRENVNRVILCTDGDFNVGITDRGELLSFITERAKSGVFLSVLGYGMGNYKDGTMELLADKGNGNYAYVDSFTEARKVLSEQLEGTLVTVAKDVKVQVEFNPARVKSYRLLGYENRALKDRDFNDDTKDAGEVGAGHQITVLYEIEPAVPNLAGVDPLRYAGKPADDEVKARLKSGHGDELLNLKLRYKAPDGETSKLIETPVKDGDREFTQASSDFKFATAVAGYGMLLRQSPHKAELTWEKVSRLAEQGLGEDKEGYRAEFVDLVRRAQQLGGGR